MRRVRGRRSGGVNRLCSPVGRTTRFACVAATKQLQHVADIRTEKSYVEHDPPIVALADVAGGRTLLLVPTLKENELVGVIGIYRQEIRPFTEKQIELVKDFAAQAVIAIENTRLLNELRQRTTDLTERSADLTEALEQQTATSEVLQVISSSPDDVQPVFATMLKNAVRICDAKFGNIYRWDGEALRLAATHNAPPAYAEARRRSPHHRLSPQSFLGRMAATKAVVHVADIAADQGYIEHRVPETVLAVELGGVRTFLAVPMLKGTTDRSVHLVPPGSPSFTGETDRASQNSPLKPLLPSRMRDCSMNCVNAPLTLRRH